MTTALCISADTDFQGLVGNYRRGCGLPSHLLRLCRAARARSPAGAAREPAPTGVCSRAALGRGRLGSCGSAGQPVTAGSGEQENEAGTSDAHAPAENFLLLVS